MDASGGEGIRAEEVKVRQPFGVERDDPTVQLTFAGSVALLEFGAGACSCSNRGGFGRGSGHVQTPQRKLSNSA